ncbi:hypothetical protein [Sphingomonas sp.]|uniref:hypothetical protein n=1 Tax=Sphingomonas sp. TaxID=28214 RepID=UPI0035BBE804
MILRLLAFAMTMACAYGAGGTATGDRMRVLDGIDRLVKARNESIDALGRVVRRPLREAGSTDYFEVVASQFTDDSPYTRIEVRKPRRPPMNRGLIIVDVRMADCIHGTSVVERYGQVDDLSPPDPRGPADQPTDYVYHRSWGKLSFGFVDTPGGQCLSRAVIDWKL